MRLAVVGHVEWVDFVPVARMPRAGEVVHAEGAFTRAAGGGGVVAAVLAELGAQVDFFCALGRDHDGEAAAEQLTARGIDLHAAWRDEATRRAVTLLEPGGERTIVTIGERLEPAGDDDLPWDELALARGVYFTAGDAASLERARAAAHVVASPRARRALEGDGPRIDALIYSAHDRDECEWAARVAYRARLLVETSGSAGGSWRGESRGRWDPVALPGEPVDSYGCGDSFAAGFTYALGAGGSVAEAAAMGAQCGARALTQAGAP